MLKGTATLRALGEGLPLRSMPKELKGGRAINNEGLFGLLFLGCLCGLVGVRGVRGSWLGLFEKNIRLKLGQGRSLLCNSFFILSFTLLFLLVPFEKMGIISRNHTLHSACAYLSFHPLTYSLF